MLGATGFTKSKLTMVNALLGENGSMSDLTPAITPIAPKAARCESSLELTQSESMKQVNRFRLSEFGSARAPMLAPAVHDQTVRSSMVLNLVSGRRRTSIYAGSRARSCRHAGRGARTLSWRARAL